MQANVDISTSEALRLAMKLDPEGDGTIGVLTKLDLMDKGTDACKTIRGDEVSLKNGFIALKNRSQAEIKNKIAIQEALKTEKLFFKSHPKYSNMDFSYFGTENLVEKLRKIFFTHIKIFLPKIYSDLKLKIKECQENLDNLGSDYISYAYENNKMNYINQTIGKFSENIERFFSGKMPNLNDNLVSHRLKLHYCELLENIQKNEDVTENIDVIILMLLNYFRIN